MSKCNRCGTEFESDFCPKCGMAKGAPVQTQSQNKKLKSWQIALIVIGAIVVAGIIGGTAGNSQDVATGGNNQTATNQITENTPQPTENNNVIVTAIELCKAYDENEVNADNLYKNKTLEITGTIESIGKDMLDDTYVTLEDGETYSLKNVQCYFKDKTEIDKVASLKKGDEITIIGQGDGAVLGKPIVKNCKIK